MFIKVLGFHTRMGKLFWNPFDDSKVLHDPNDTDKGLCRPLEVA